MQIRILVLTALSFSTAAQAIACQNFPTLQRSGTVTPPMAGNLEGFKVTHTVVPKVSSSKAVQAEGSVVAVTLTVAGGKPVHAEFHDNGTPLARGVERAAMKWRFDMPRDGTSPVMVDLVFRYDHRKFWPDISVNLPASH